VAMMKLLSAATDPKCFLVDARFAKCASSVICYRSGARETWQTALHGLQAWNLQASVQSPHMTNGMNGLCLGLGRIPPPESEGQRSVVMSELGYYTNPQID
jgi:hypothetical protein